jgi:hypothetical protein
MIIQILGSVALWQARAIAPMLDKVKLLGDPVYVNEEEYLKEVAAVSWIVGVIDVTAVVLLYHYIPF